MGERPLQGETRDGRKWTLIHQLFLTQGWVLLGAGQGGGLMVDRKTFNLETSPENGSLPPF
jgi:hypothetical protein